MHFPEILDSCDKSIARAADVCLKPGHHSVLIIFQDSEDQINRSIPDELIVKLESRDEQGVRHPERDLELEIYKSGKELNITIFWSNQSEKPILWQGKHPIWMEPVTGTKCDPPAEGVELEALARRLRALFESEKVH